eukprot:TRINITY_DN1536_c0_g1_i2.p1 TRINITY_DN1536_c0_g1~~TRINITY_DN1536_c0_g1_i2.p1  ORF type:complete len:189 (+),score=28.02 TRINITY_DN1536_c0_g1_i2:77-643(+)
MSYIEQVNETLQKAGAPVDVQTLVVIFVSLIAVFITFFVLKKSSKVRGDTVLLLGDVNSGKTIMFYLLIFGSKVSTYTSMKGGYGLYQNDRTKKPIKVHELPGHNRLRSNLQTLITSASRIVFVVDAASFEVRPVAQYLYDVLTNKVVNAREIPIMIFCNKMDKENPLSVPQIQAELEKELHVVIFTI